jgi:DNA-binding response OmpR family regulator
MPRKFRLLVIDDESSIRKPLVIYLRSQGYDVAEAENAIEGLDCLKRSRYDLLILDLKMPYLSGADLSRIMDEENLQVPILVITACANGERLKQEVGRLQKAFSLETLLQTVQIILPQGKSVS